MTRFPLSLLAASALAFAGCNKPRPAASAQPEAAPGADAPAAVASNDSSAPAAGGNGPGGGGPRQGGGQRMSPAERVEQMKASLGLSDEQAQKVAAAFEAQRPSMEALRNDQSLSREQRREKMQEMREAMDTQLTGILTPEQKTKWDEERAKMRERFANRQGGGQGNRQNRQGGNGQSGGPSPNN